MVVTRRAVALSRQNDENYRRLHGSAVLFGQNVQLLHVNSHKFVNAQPRKLAETEKDCIMLELETHSDEGSYFQLVPRFRHRSEGDPIRLTDLVKFLSPTLHMYMHASRFEQRKHQRTEVRCPPPPPAAVLCAARCCDALFTAAALAHDVPRAGQHVYGGDHLADRLVRGG